MYITYCEDFNKTKEEKEFFIKCKNDWVGNYTQLVNFVSSIRLNRNISSELYEAILFNLDEMIKKIVNKGTNKRKMKKLEGEKQ